MAKQEKVRNLYSAVKNNFYLCRDDLTVGNDKFNSALLFGVLTELNKGNQILYGEYGGGKTTSAEYLHSIFHNVPIDIVRRSVVRGNPQLTQEKIIGRPDYGKMHQGQERVVWQHFVLVPPKIVDEFNRIPESNQSMLLEGVDRGEWGYLNEHIAQGRQPFFATCNYEDRGNNTLIPPLLDRFDIATESKFPGVANALAIGNNWNNGKDEILKDPEISREILGLLNSGKHYDEISSGLKKFSDKFRIKLKSRKLETLTEQELAEIDKEIEGTGLAGNAVMYLGFLISELNQHAKYGQKRSNDPISGEEGNYLYNLLKGSGSRREEKSIVRYAKSLAWFQGKKEANLEHVLSVAPYTLWHRVRLTEDLISKFKDDKREDPLNLYIVQKLLGEGTSDVRGVKKKFVESSRNYQTIMSFIQKNKLGKAREAAEAFASDGKGHPIFLDLMEELK